MLATEAGTVRGAGYGRTEMKSVRRQIGARYIARARGAFVNTRKRKPRIETTIRRELRRLRSEIGTGFS
jgi:hypothetical protein